MTQAAFQNIWLFGHLDSHDVPETLQALIDAIATKNVTLFLEASLAPHLKLSHNTQIIPDETPPPETDLLLVVGGDGSLLSAAHKALVHQLPMLGVHRGYLGFLTDIDPSALESLNAVLSGAYRRETRHLLKATLRQKNREDITHFALNEAALLSRGAAELLSFLVYIDGKLVCRQRADGIIISTPTGSTAYALSAGGPILHPELSAITLVPLAPHTLSSRPIVIPHSQQIVIKVCDNNRITPTLSCDSQVSNSAPAGSGIHISTHDRTLTLIHPEDYCYFDTLRVKLGWEQHTGKDDSC